MAGRTAKLLSPRQSLGSLLRAVSSKSGGQKFGQPTEWTHPHLVGRDEVTPGLSRVEFRRRREGLVEALLATSGQQQHLLVLPAATRQYMVDKIPFPYRQDTDFRYLTGCLQPDTVLVIEFDRTTSKSIMFCKESTVQEERWEGSRIGFGECVRFLGVDEAAPLQSLESYVSDYISRKARVSLWADPAPCSPTSSLLEGVLRERSRLGGVDSPRPAIHTLRSVKSPAEQELMRRSCQVGAEALKAAMAASKPFGRSQRLSTEAELLATIEYQARMRGACRPAYPAVVASGEAACTIHYTRATAPLAPGQLVLVDAGCEYHGYSSDITRTWPPGGTFSPPQLGLYEAVLDTQQKLIESIKPGVTTIDGLYGDMMRVLGRNLQELGVIGRGVEVKQLAARTNAFCPHHVSHHLGMDVHDVPTVSKSSKLLPGMVITVEPGCYIPSSMAKVGEEWLGLGVRVEDDLLVTEGGVEVLSRACPRTVGEMEALLATC